MGHLQHQIRELEDNLTQLKLEIHTSKSTLPNCRENQKKTKPESDPKEKSSKIGQGQPSPQGVKPQKVSKNLLTEPLPPAKVSEHPENTKDEKDLAGMTTPKGNNITSKTPKGM